MSKLPPGFEIELDEAVRRDGHVLIRDRAPYRIIRLTDPGLETFRAVARGVVESDAARRLAGRLVEAEMAHPKPVPSQCGQITMTAVVPARDRPELLDRCLEAIGKSIPVVVVDDGSRDADAVADVCERHCARRIRLPFSRGPSAARNAALQHVDSDVVAFVDSDVVVTPRWHERLLPYFDDPAVGAVAPRVVPMCASVGSVTLARFLEARCPLDMGPRPGEVGFGRAVRYVPSATLLVRRRANPLFDEDLTVGEDVDLVWRLAKEGWILRYVPDVVVHHREPPTWSGALTRRFRYGGSVAPLSRRHPGRLPHVVLPPWGVAVAGLALARRGRLALAVAAARTAVVAKRCHAAGAPAGTAARWGAVATARSVAGIGHAATMFAFPSVGVGVAAKRTRATVLLLAAMTPADELGRVRPRLGPVRWVACSVLDDVAYGAGVVHGCIRHRTIEPLRPVAGHPHTADASSGLSRQVRNA